jgi:hypothetical protein
VRKKKRMKENSKKKFRKMGRIVENDKKYRKTMKNKKKVKKGA